MNFTDIFIRRPVLASVVSLLILVLGLRSATLLHVQQFPTTESAVITVTTAYFGASPDLVASFITAPLENAVSQANGIDYITSSSGTGVSTITANLRLNYDPNRALNEISTKVNSIRDQLPPESQLPVLTLSLGQQLAAMYIGFSSDVLAANQITDYVIRIVQPRLQALEGVQSVDIFGAKNFALRAWLDPQRLAAYGLTATDVNRALAANNFLSSLGQTKGQMVQVGLVASTGLHSLEEFRNLVVKQAGGAIVRLDDVANVTLGSEDYDSGFAFNGNDAVALGINVAPGANLLDVTNAREGCVRRNSRDVAGGPERGSRLRLGAVRARFDSRSCVHDRRGPTDRHPRGVRIPGLAPFCGDPRHCDSIVAHRRVDADAGRGLFGQSADAPRPGPGHRAGG